MATSPSKEVKAPQHFKTRRSHQRREIVVDRLLLETAPVRREALVERYRVPARVLPVRDAGRDLPGLLVVDRDLCGMDAVATPRGLSDGHVDGRRGDEVS